MIRKGLIIWLLVLTIGLFSCQENNATNIYTNDDPFTIELDHDTVKILQLTDLHLTYGIDVFDRKTFSAIKTLVSSDDFDLVVISGDMTLSPNGPRLFQRLVKVMEELQTNWTFVFGNHETDFNRYEDYLQKTANTNFLYFKAGPELSEGGVGNFRIQFTHNEIPLYTVYLRFYYLNILSLFKLSLP